MLVLVCFVVILAILIITSIWFQVCKTRVQYAVNKFAPDAKTILDLGCGSCCNTRFLEGDGIHIVSLDVVDKGKCNHPQLFDGERIPYCDGSFDLGICSFVLHHTPKHIHLIKELRRTCKKVIVIEDTPTSKNQWNYCKTHADSDWGSCIACFKEAKGWREEFWNAGFKIISEETLSKWRCPFSAHPFFYPVTSTVFYLS